jgi:hypothetical protein
VNENEILDVILRAQLDQHLAVSERYVNEYVDVVRNALKDQDVIDVWARAGNTVMENLTRGDTTVQNLVNLLATALVHIAQIEEKEKNNG